MNVKGGRRGSPRRPAAVPGRPRRASGPNASRGRAMPSGSLYLQEGGRSKFYPDGGREKPSFPRGVQRPPRRNLSPNNVRNPPPAKHAMHFNPVLDLEGREYEMDESDDDSYDDNKDPPNRQLTSLRNYLIICTIGCVVVVAFLAAVIVPVAILGGSTGPTVTGNITLRTSFITAFGDTSSTQYINLKADFESAMDQAFQNSATYVNDFRESTVTDLTAGVTTTVTVVVFSLGFNSDVEITRLYRNNVFKFLAVETGRAGTPFLALDVVANTLFIVDSCSIDCANGGILDVIDCTCMCATGFSGSTCTIVG